MRIFRGRTEPCKDGLGGVKRVYLFKYSQEVARQARGQRGVSLTSYPPTLVYAYNVQASSFSENRAQDLGDWSQSFSATLTKQTLSDTIEIETLIGIELGLIIEGWDGLFRLVGAENGCRIESATAATGGAKNDLNGYTISIEANERYKSLLFTDLVAAGFSIATENNYLLSELLEILTDGVGNRLTYA